jgi:hypothetical protein
LGNDSLAGPVASSQAVRPITPSTFSAELLPNVPP